MKFESFDEARSFIVERIKLIEDHEIKFAAWLYLCGTEEMTFDDAVCIFNSEILVLLPSC